MEISRPIFIIGVPRSGTTLLYNLMAHHKDLAWFSQYDLSKVFSKEFLHFYKLRKRLFDIREWSYGKRDIPNYEVLFDVPIEFPQFWEHYIGQDWADEKDVDDSSKKHLRETISQIIISKNKKRFLSKYPRNSVRIRYLNKVFPGSIFVNIVRDGRAVVASMLNRILWNHVSYFRNNTSNVNELTFAKMDGYFGIPLKNGNQSQFNFLETHALQWIEVLEEINKAKNYLKPEPFFELKKILGGGIFWGRNTLVKVLMYPEIVDKIMMKFFGKYSLTHQIFLELSNKNQNQDKQPQISPRIIFSHAEH